MMKKTFLGCLALTAALLAPAVAASGVLEVSKLNDLDKPGAMLNANLPWHGNFTQLLTLKPGSVQTRFKIAHDNKNLYLGIEAYDDMSKLICTEYPRDDRKRTHNDNLVIDFDSEGSNMAGGKIVVDANGGITDFWGNDDNTGTGRFIFSPEWNSSAKVISAKKYSDRWTVEMSIPLGTFFRNVKNLDKLRFNIARERVKAKELLSYAKNPSLNFAASRYFNELKLKDFDADPFQWLIASVKVDGKRSNGECKAIISAKLWNQSKKWRIGQCRISLRDTQGKQYIRNVGIHAEKMRSFNINEVIPQAAPGRFVLDIDLLDTRGNLVAASNTQLELDFQAVKIQVLEPAYRDNIYFTQKLNKIKAGILLTENIGKPLKVTLTGPENFSKILTIPAAEEYNIAEFDFPGNMPVGEYILKVGECTKVIRKLPKNADEVRIGKNNVTYVNGKIFLPMGYFTIDPEWKSPGINQMTYFRDVWKDGAEIKRFLDRLAKAGMRGVIYPYIEPSGQKKVFASKARQLDKLTDEQKHLVREAVSVCRNHPGLLAYYVADEPEGHGHNEEWYADLYKFLSELDPYHPTMICNYGTAGIQRFYRGADIVQADAYPDYFTDNTNSRPLSVCYEYVKYASALRSPWLALHTFDWALKNPRGSYSRSPSYDEVREQMFLGVLANAKGFTGYIATMPGSLSNQLRVTKEHIGKEVSALKEIVLQDTSAVKFSPANKALYAGIKRLNKEFALIAVNTSSVPVKVTFQLDKGVAELALSGEKRSVKVSNGKFTDTIPPHRAHLYLTSGLKADSVDHQAVRNEIAQRDKDRFRPGNLVAAGELNRRQIHDYKQGIIPPHVPKITVSSQLEHPSYKKCATQYFLQDGIRETTGMQFMTWAPAPNDKQPWLEFELKKDSTLEKAMIYLHKSTLGAQLKSGKILAVTPEGKYIQIGSFANNDKFVIEVKLQAVKTRKVRIELTEFSTRGRMLEEIEIYGK